MYVNKRSGAYWYWWPISTG